MSFGSSAFLLVLIGNWRENVLRGTHAFVGTIKISNPISPHALLQLLVRSSGRVLASKKSVLFREREITLIRFRSWENERNSISRTL